ncbi:hypothetical protein [Natronosalvus caseinilyticus]|uniref:hypothetical protein n=1 Tax=Natronosalvus caseinilyticus TaxID=2953747 RepID=UPI0028B10609|nr:hypothetical protein [Natronosalvus caseinilyticus]
MAELHLSNGQSKQYEKVIVKENGWAIGILHGRPDEAFPPDKIERVDLDEDVYTASYLHEEEYGESRQARPDEPGESVTEFKPVHRMELEYHFE